MFDARATTTEFLDRPDCDPSIAAASYRFMEMVNFWFGGIRMVRHFLETETGKRHSVAPLRILDIGSGTCDIPLAVSRWASTCGIPLQFTCLEKAAYAVDIARRKLSQAGNTSIHLFQEDAFVHQPAEPYDCAVASMCFHHFSDAQILALLERLKRFVQHSVLINDLRRSRRAYLAAGLLLTNKPAALRHDALLSIRRGFKTSELSALLGQLENITVSVKPSRWFRIAAIIRFKTGENS